jgi:hypothetical protein
LWGLGFELRALHQPFFCDGVFWDRILHTICPGWPWTTICGCEPPRPSPK